MAYLGMIGFVVYKNPRGRLNRLCALTIGTFAIWTLGFAFSHNAVLYTDAMMWINVAAIGWCSFPVPILWFYLAFTKHERVLKTWPLVIASVLLAIFFISQQWSGYMASGIRQPYGWASIWATSIQTGTFFAYYLFSLIACIYLSYNLTRKAKSHREKKQARILYIAPSITLVLGTITDAIMPVLGISFPPVGIIAVLFWAGGLVYTVTRFGLMTLTPSAAADDILATMSDSLVLLDRNGKIVTVNPATLGLIGYTAGELIGKKFNSIVAQEEPRGDSFFHGLLEIHNIHNSELRYRTKDGKIIPVLVSASTMKNTEGELIGFVINAHDITEFKRTEEALKTSEERFRSIVENSHEGIFIVDARYKFIYVNDELCQILQYPSEEIVGHDFREFLDEESRQFVGSMYVRKQKGESIPHRYEFNVVRKDGEKRRVEIGSSVITDSKGNVRTVAQILDITERKEMEEKLRRNSEDLRKMNRELIVAKEMLNKTNIGLNEELSKRNVEVEKLLIQKDEFIGQLGHELKNPLGPIVNLIPLLEKREKNPESKEILEVMHRNAGHMKNLVVKTIELARLNSPNVELTIEDTNLLNEVNNVVEKNKLLLRQNNIKINNNIDENIMIKSDKLRLEELFDNLINNAIKYGKGTGTITIDAKEDKDFVTVFVKDTGMGMNEKQLSRIFDEFYKADDSRHDFDSSGLGLPICKRIVEKHGGKIWAESLGEGKGTTMFFTIPTSYKDDEFVISIRTD